jgi:hypothetical protein
MNTSFHDIEPPREGRLLRDFVLLEEIIGRFLDDYTEAVAELRLAAASECGPSRLVLQAAATRLLARAQAHRALQPPKAGGKMELGGHLEHVCAALSTARLADCEAWLTLAVDEVWLDADRCWLVSLIVAELIKTLAWPAPPGGRRPIGVKIVNGGWRMVGAVAAPGHASTGKGRGRRLVEALSAALDGTVEWGAAQDSCCAWFELPIESPARTLRWRETPPEILAERRRSAAGARK